MFWVTIQAAIATKHKVNNNLSYFEVFRTPYLKDRAIITKSDITNATEIRTDARAPSKYCETAKIVPIIAKTIHVS